MKKIILLIASVFVYFSSSTQTIRKIELDSINLVEKLEHKFMLESKKSQNLTQDDFKINHLINKQQAIKTTNSTLFINNQHNWFLFYHKKQLIFAYNEYWENSRMGSCGDISIHNYYFIKNNQFTSKWHFE